MSPKSAPLPPVPATAKTCKHLRHLETVLRAEGRKVATEHPNWVEGEGPKGYSVYFDHVFDKKDLKKLGLAPKEAKYMEYGLDGQYAGFHCLSCHCAVVGQHPLFKKKPARPVKNGKKKPFR